MDAKTTRLAPPAMPEAHSAFTGARSQMPEAIGQRGVQHPAAHLTWTQMCAPHGHMPFGRRHADGTRTEGHAGEPGHERRRLRHTPSPAPRPPIQEHPRVQLYMAVLGCALPKPIMQKEICRKSQSRPRFKRCAWCSQYIHNVMPQSMVVVVAIMKSSVQQHTDVRDVGIGNSFSELRQTHLRDRADTR